MKPCDKFFYAEPEVRLANNYVAVEAKPAEGRALARELNQVVAKHCGQRVSADERELRSLSPTAAERRHLRLMEFAVRRVLDTGAGE
jgi:hypothetical protein